MSSENSRDHQPSDLGRLVALIDGVFAVAMTLLVLDLKLPVVSTDMASALTDMLPGFLIYLIVFASVAGYWIQHHSAFKYVARPDARLIVLSLINLLFVTLYPVTASIVGAHPLEPLAILCLSANSLLYCLSAQGIWAYAAAHPALLTEDAGRPRLKHLATIMLLVAVCLTIAIPLAFLSVYLAYADLILCTPVATWLSRSGRKAT
jgi:uncharacterized membrane protein